jgi:hypothetical protein
VKLFADRQGVRSCHEGRGRASVNERDTAVISEAEGPLRMATDRRPVGTPLVYPGTLAPPAQA